MVLVERYFSRWLFLSGWCSAGLWAPPPGRALRTTALGLRCIMWMLQTSLDKAVHLSALKHLATMTISADFDPAIVMDCLDVLIGYINVGEEAVVRGSEQLATVSAICFIRTFDHLSVTNPTSSVLKDVCRRFRRVFPSMTRSVRDPSAGSVIFFVNKLIYRALGVQSSDYRPPTQERVLATREMAEAAQVEYHRARHGEVPSWILSIAYHSLPLDPLPPMSIVANCLLIFAIDLGCVISDIGFTTSEDERCVRAL